jgi:hypothetical protein
MGPGSTPAATCCWVWLSAPAIAAAPRAGAERLGRCGKDETFTPSV